MRIYCGESIVQSSNQQPYICPQQNHSLQHAPSVLLQRTEWLWVCLFSSWSKVRSTFTSLTKSFLRWCILAKNQTHESVLCSAFKSWNKESLKSSSYPPQSLLLVCIHLLENPWYSIFPSSHCQFPCTISVFYQKRTCLLTWIVKSQALEIWDQEKKL